MLYIIYTDIESLIKKKKIDGSANNSETSSTTKIGEHIPSGYSMSGIWAFDDIENKHTLHREEDCMKIFLSFLREHATNILNFEKNKMLKLRQYATNCYMCRKGV